MTELNLLRGLKENLDNVPIADGNLIITKDTGEIFADFGADRVALGGDDLPLEKGEAEESIQQEGAKALGPKSIALGTSIAGCKGYYFSGIELTNHFIYLSQTQVEPVITTASSPADSSLYDASFSCEWQNGDKISIVNGAHYDEQLTIRGIYGNCIWVTKPIPFDAIKPSDSADDYTVCVPTRPEAGVVPLGEGAISAGDGGSATGRGAVNFARDGRAFGDYSFNVGRDNEVGYASATLGALLKHLGQYGLSAGWGNETTGDFAITLGGGLINPYENGVILGWCNDPTIPNLLLGIGCGDGGGRKNAFNVNRNGDVWVSKDPTIPMGVVPKQYVDAIETTLGTAIKQKQDVTRREVITVSVPIRKSLSPNKYYVIDTNGEQVSFVNIALTDPTNTDIVNEHKLRISNIGQINFFTSKGTDEADNIITIYAPANLSIDAEVRHVITMGGQIVDFTNITLEDGIADKEYKLRINGLNGVNFYNAKTDESIAISGPSNLSLDSEKYYEITTNGQQVDFTNVTLQDGMATSYKLRVSNISRLAFYTPDGAPASIEGLPETYEEGKTYEISIINGVATYTTYPTSIEGLPESYDASKTYEISIVNGVATYTTYNGDGTIKGLPESYDPSKVYEISIIDGYGKYEIVSEDRVIPIEKGGTGATDVATARANLGITNNLPIEVLTTDDVSISTSFGQVTIYPNRYYILPDDLGYGYKLTLGTETNSNSNVVQEYKFRVTYTKRFGISFSNATVKGLPTPLEAGTYEISVINGYASYTVLQDVHEWQNPPLYEGEEYRTTERWKGKPVYTRLINCLSLPESGRMYVEVDSSYKPIRVVGQWIGGALPYHDSGENGNIEIAAEKGYIVFNVNLTEAAASKLGLSEAYAQIWYTKN